MELFHHFLTHLGFFLFYQTIKKSRTEDRKPRAIEANDLLTEILLRVPSYSIRRFESTCKQWHALIANPEFRRQWHDRNKKPATGLILCMGRVLDSDYYPNYDEKKYEKTNFVPFSSRKSKPKLSRLPNLKIKQSCNGLLLCETDHDYCVCDPNFGYRVYNPTTNKMSSIPEGIGCLCSMSLAYDPSKSSYYKIIACTKGRDLLLQIHIFSSRTRRWTLALDHIPQKYLGEGVYWNGSIHWIDKLLYFNIEDHTLKDMPAMPPADTNWMLNEYFGESCGRLNYVRKDRSAECFIDVYELQTDYSQWVLKYHISLQDFDDSVVLSLVHGADEDDSFLILMQWRKIVRYNLVVKTPEELHQQDLRLEIDCRHAYHAFQYIESQCSV